MIITSSYVLFFIILPSSFQKEKQQIIKSNYSWIPVNQPNIGHKLPSQENELILKSVRNDNSEACQFGLKKNNRHNFLNDIWGVRTLRVSWQSPNPSSFSLLCSVTFAKSLNLCPPLPIFKLELFYWLYKIIVSILPIPDGRILGNPNIRARVNGA